MGENMLPLIKTLETTLRHKWYLLVAGVTVDGWVNSWRLVSWRRLLLHDMSKLLPSELVPYSKFFHAADKSVYKAEFKRAFELHCRRNDHHFQHWSVDPNGRHNMPDDAAAEMALDWLAAARGYSGAFPKNYLTWDWYQSVGRHYKLSRSTWYMVHYVLDEFFQARDENVSLLKTPEQLRFWERSAFADDDGA